MLVKAGANLFLYDYENQAPLHVAKRRKRKALFKYFKKKMEDEEPQWICDVSNTGWDSPTEPTSSASSGLDIGVSYDKQVLLTARDNDDKKEQDKDIMSDDDDNHDTPKLQSRPSSKHQGNSNHSLSPPTSMTQPATNVALGVSPLHHPSAVADNFMNPSNRDAIAIQLPPAMKKNIDSNGSNISTFSQQSSNSSNDGIGGLGGKDRETDENDPSNINNNNGNSMAFQQLKFQHSGSVKQSSNPVIPSRNRDKIGNKYSKNKSSSRKRYSSQSPGPTSAHHQYPTYQQSVSDSQHTPSQRRSHNLSSKQRQRKKLSQSPQIRSTSSHSRTSQQSQAHLWMTQHQQKLKQVQENKLKMALKIEQSHLNKEV